MFYRTSSPSGPLPKKDDFFLTAIAGFMVRGQRGTPYVVGVNVFCNVIKTKIDERDWGMNGMWLRQ